MVLTALTVWKWLCALYRPSTRRAQSYERVSLTRAASIAA
jgi:hypothetical protein